MKTRILIISICAVLIFSCGRRQERLRLESERKELEQQEYAEKEWLRVLKQQKEEMERIVQEKRNKIDTQKNELNEVILLLDKPFDIQKYCNTINDIQSRIDLFYEWAKLITIAEKSEDTELQELAKKVKAKVKKYQLRAFPIMRKSFAKLFAKVVWELDVDVDISGDRNQFIYFTWAGFQLNKNIKDFQNGGSEILNRLRYSESRYCRYYRQQTDYYYTMHSVKDSDIIY